MSTAEKTLFDEILYLLIEEHKGEYAIVFGAHVVVIKAENKKAAEALGSGYFGHEGFIVEEIVLPEDDKLMIPMPPSIN